jgi:hypothetical protein
MMYYYLLFFKKKKVDTPCNEKLWENTSSLWVTRHYLQHVGKNIEILLAKRHEYGSGKGAKWGQLKMGYMRHDILSAMCVGVEAKFLSRFNSSK